MKKQLIITTNNDLSLDLLKVPELTTDVEYYSTELLSKVSKLPKYDIVYFRDPFNTGQYDPTLIRDIVSEIHQTNPNDYYVDSVDSFDDLIIEDKWIQYQILKPLMPKTELVQDFTAIDFDKQLAKKRISSRALGILLYAKDVDASFIPSDYIVQNKLNISREYRVISVKQKIIKQGVTKIKRRPGKPRVKIADAVEIEDDVVEFAKQSVSMLPKLDFAGLDIARLNDNSLVLIEANRSPQFNSYARVTGLNPYDLLIDKITTN